MDDRPLPSRRSNPLVRREFPLWRWLGAWLVAVAAVAAFWYFVFRWLL